MQGEKFIKSSARPILLREFRKRRKLTQSTNSNLGQENKGFDTQIIQERIYNGYNQYLVVGPTGRGRIQKRWMYEEDVKDSHGNELENYLEMKG